MSRFRPGEQIIVTVRAIVTDHVGDVLEYSVTGPSSVDKGAVNTTWSSVGVEHAAPAGWPPLPGDVWRDRENDIWFVSYLGVSLEMRRPDGRHGIVGDLTEDYVFTSLVHREQDGAVSS